MSTEAHSARLDAAPRFTDSGRSTHGVDCYRPTSDEADVRSKARFEMSTIECEAEAACVADVDGHA